MALTAQRSQEGRIVVGVVALSFDSEAHGLSDFETASGVEGVVALAAEPEEVFPHVFPSAALLQVVDVQLPSRPAQRAIRVFVRCTRQFLAAIGRVLSHAVKTFSTAQNRTLVLWMA